MSKSKGRTPQADKGARRNERWAEDMREVRRSNRARPHRVAQSYDPPKYGKNAYLDDKY